MWAVSVAGRPGQMAGSSGRAPEQYPPRTTPLHLVTLHPAPGHNIIITNTSILSQQHQIEWIYEV